MYCDCDVCFDSAETEKNLGRLYNFLYVFFDEEANAKKFSGCKSTVLPENVPDRQKRQKPIFGHNFFQEKYLSILKRPFDAAYTICVSAKGTGVSKK